MQIFSKQKNYISYTLTDEYLNNTPLSLINQRGMLGEH